MVKKVKENNIKLGVCYYPEHWDESMWESDFQRMKDLDFTYIRIAEFAWSIFEPEEGKFSFDLFDRAIELADQYGLKVILGTPTATPPAWLTYKYPEVLNVSQEGVQYQHGQRRHYNYNAPIYRELSERIVKKMVEHYGNNPAVAGWQLDNELNCEIDVFYSDADHTAFRKWLEDKYQTLENLNKAWGAVFWNQTYTSWEQVHLTRPTVSDSPNPHQALDEKRFFSDSAISYAGLQAKTIRSEANNQWITTNGMFGHLDNHKMTDELLDFFAYDSYPNFSKVFPDTGEKPLLDRKWSWNLSTVRSISPNYAIFEQQSGPGGWVNRINQPSPKPGQLRLWTYQSIAHGADMVLYFRWRTAAFGTEIYWHGINDYHNQPNRRIEEVKKVSKEISKVGKAIAGSIYQAEVAIVRDYENEWDGELDGWHGNFTKDSQTAWFKALQYSHIPVDSLNFSKQTNIEELNKYKVLIFPHPAILIEESAELLEQYAKQGGKIVFGCRSAYKNKYGHPYQLPFPGMLRSLTGIEIKDFTMIGGFEEPPLISWKSRQKDIAVPGFNEVLELKEDGIEVLAEFKKVYYEGSAALTKKAVGNGYSYYFGGVFTLAIAEALIEELGLKPMLENLILPENIEVAVRKNEGNKYAFLLNYASTAQEITFEKEQKDMLTGNLLNGSYSMNPYDVLILELNE